MQFRCPLWKKKNSIKKIKMIGNGEIMFHYHMKNNIKCPFEQHAPNLNNQYA